MIDAHENESLAFLDSFFLYVEQPGAPVNVASVSAFEGEIGLDECVRYIESKLETIPRFMQRVVPAAFGVSAPTWQYDPDFDLGNHVREIRLKRGTEAEWKAEVSRILSENFVRSRPLWDLTLFHGLQGKQTGVMVRAHHCLVDGIAGVGLLKALLEDHPVVAPAKRRRRRARATVERTPATALLDGIIQGCLTTAQALLTVHSELLRMAENALPHTNASLGGKANGIKAGGAFGAVGELAKLLSELARPTQKLPYNVLCHGPQKFEWLELPMEEIAAVKQACNATVNDVVITVLTAALRRYAEEHNINTKGRTLRLVIPVNLRDNGDASGFGNRITFLPVDLEMGTRDPRKLLETVQQNVRFSKTAHGAELVGLAGVLLSALPTPLQSVTGTVLSQLPISVCNSICTNVPGPQTPLYLLGHKLLSTYPYVPIGGEMGMNCAVMSYNGTLFAGFTGDAQAIPDLARLAKFFSESFVELRDAVVVRKAKAKRARRIVRPEMDKTVELVESSARSAGETVASAAAIA